MELLFDYLAFVVLTLAVLAISLYSRLSGKKKESKAEYVFAKGSQVSMAAMLLSLARGNTGVRSFLGYPSELYYYGSGMYEILFGMLLAGPFVSYLFVPIYYNLDITSIYEYLDLRFKSHTVRYLASGTYIIKKLLTLGVTVFTPCVILKTIFGFPYWMSITATIFTSVVCSVLGGLKVAIMADVMQTIIMIACTLVIIIMGSLNYTGGFSSIVTTNYENGRLNLFNFDVDPTVRVTTVSAIIGQFFIAISLIGCQQNFSQRYCSMQSIEQVQKTMWYNVPVLAIIFSLSWIAGMVVYANYVTCDPLTAKLIDKIDEILPFYIQDKFARIPGLMGVFMGSLFNGTISLTVSNLNSMSTVVWEDFFSKLPCFSKATDSDAQQLKGIKMMNVLLGGLTMVIAFGVSSMSGIIQSTQLMMAATSGPLLGVFVLAIFVPSCNWKGAVSGMVISNALTLWVVSGSMTINKPKTPMLPLSVEGCNNQSFTDHTFHYQPDVYLWTKNNSLNNTKFTEITNEKAPNDMDFLTKLYSVTFMYYSLMGCTICVVAGLIISCIAGSNEEDLYEEKLIHPAVLRLSRCLPGTPRKFLQKNTNATDMKMIEVFESARNVGSS